jgi:hypothetical protein
MSGLQRLPVGLFLCFLLMSGRAAPAGEFVPFMLKGEGVLEVDVETLFGTFQTTGVATQLGRHTAEGTVQFLPPNEHGILVADTLEVTFTAANGDELNAVLSEEGGFLDAVTGVGSAVYRFDGGTGRFEHAAGRAVLDVLVAPDGSFTTTLIGRISRPTRENSGT